MQKSVNQYFNGEVFQCTIGIIAAVIFIILALYLFFVVKTQYAKGFGYPSFIISVLVLIICASVVKRSPADIKRVNSFVQNEPDKIRTIELPRIQKVMRNFKVIEFVEIGLALLSLLAFFIIKNEMWKGVSLGALALSILMFLFDFFAEKRGKVYLDFLQSLEY